MFKSLLWRAALVLGVVVWAAFSAWPPNNQNLFRVFEQQARNKDADFDKLLKRIAEKRSQKTTVGEYETLRDAISELKIPLKKYFSTSNLSQDDQDDALQEYLKAEKLPATVDPQVVQQANRLVLRRILHEAEGKIHLGLDLKGGSSFLLKMDLSKIDPSQRSFAQGKAVEIIRHRVDVLGVSEPIINPVGTDRLMVQIPGALTDEQRAEARESLKKITFLEFRLVYPDEAQAKDFLERGEIPPGYEVKQLREKRYNPNTHKREKYEESLLVSIQAEQGLTGKYIKSAQSTIDQSGEALVSFEFDDEGARIFENITRENIKHRLAILLDGEVKSAPVIQSVISGRGQITGAFTLQEAQELANTLQNPLEHPLTLEEERTVTATLGADSVKAGFVAGLIGLGVVLVFMASYYLIAGVIADVCLLLNMIILIGVLAQFGFTLTLPGIAALILTIGMAVDANVLIYERLREELATGKKLRSAIPLAFHRTAWTIFDANTTTIITALVLIKFGAGPVMGFAVVLSVGILSSVFVALVICRLFFDGLTVRDTITRAKMFHLIRSAHVNFLRWRNLAMTGSGALIIAGIAAFVWHGEGMFGVDFTGGDSFALKFAQRVSTEQMTETLTQSGVRDVALQYQTQLEAGGTELLYIKTPFNSGEHVLSTLKGAFPQAQFTALGQIDRVGPALGLELAFNSALGLAIGLVLVLIYVSLRFEFSFAIGAIVALIHDVVITIGVMAILGKQLTLPMIGAILTIAGYSINDTIVIFDRIREGLKIKTGTLESIMNASINETLSRTLLTSSTSLMTLLAVFFFGGKTIHDFALALIIGVVIGTYSSIFIASPIVLLWGRRKGKIEAGTAMASKPLQ